MASNLLPFTPSPIRAASSDHPNKLPESKRRRNSSTSAAQSSSSWWTPLFGWSSDPDYIADGPLHQGKLPEADSSPEKQAPGRSGRFVPGCFTEQKARRLRMMTSEASAFHDTMYHSAIASRLASDFGNDHGDDE
ncbi:hypothetical protein MLD38_014813 [Melastoma candidum]|uniref:Uncharacterized protein n=1 Tax=Melastoma candidum TaxID=119954 RepID=A0ACB9RDV4_9MYRT|nr:hypothetical protein MLD38_014813 [Melastoma candidum]